MNKNSKNKEEFEEKPEDPQKEEYEEYDFFVDENHDEDLDFEILSKINNIETIASGREIRILNWLNETYGKGNWKKLKGITTVKYKRGKMKGKACVIELHWFEAPNIGRRLVREKFILKEL